jgi:Na+:H+ antiporter
MTDYVILILCLIVIISYLFDISSVYSKIPGVIFLILLGIGIQVIAKYLNLGIPNLKPLLPVMGTLGLVMIVMDASLDLKLERKKKGLVIKSIASALILFLVFSGMLSFILVELLDIPVRDALLNSIPLGVISSSVAIPAAINLTKIDREFVIYESSFSDIFGILLFDFILFSEGPVGHRIFGAAFNTLLTLIISVATAIILAILLHKITYHVNYVIIMTSVVLVYILAKLSHLPALMLVLTFGLVLANNRLFKNHLIEKFVDFDKFESDMQAFKRILSELTFLVRSFFFIIFGYYTRVDGIFNLQNLLMAGAITAGILFFRMLFLKQVLRMKLKPLVFFQPRGLITILLFLTIPAASRLSIISEEVVTLVILFTIIILVIGNFSNKAAKIPVTDLQDLKNGDLSV